MDKGGQQKRTYTSEQKYRRYKFVDVDARQLQVVCRSLDTVQGASWGDRMITLIDSSTSISKILEYQPAVGNHLVSLYRVEAPG